MVWGIIAGGYLLTRPVDDGSAKSIASEVGFNHPQKYEQIHGGAGTSALTGSVQGWKSSIAADFDEVARLLDEANAKAGVAWQGAAAEAHGNSVKPMSNFVRDSKDVSTGVGDAAEHQVDNYTAVRDTMPEPKKVTATDSLLEKGGAWLVGSQTDLQRQEQEAMERAQEAQRVYGTYSTGSGNVSSSLPRYPEAPKLQYTDQPAGGGGRVGVDSGSGYTGSNVSNGGGTYWGGGSGSGSSGNGSDLTWDGGSTGGSSRTSEGSGSGGNSGGSDGPPAESDSAWTAPPPATAGATPLPGTGTGTPGGGPGGGGALGVIGGGVGGGRGGSVSGRGGAGSGYGRGGFGSGVGGRSGSGSGLGAGGRSGSGLGAGGRSGSGIPSTSSAYSSNTSSAGARGGMMGGAGARGAQGDEDEEHENKYMVPTDEAWEDLGLPRTAPAVIGEDLEPPQH